MNTTQDASLDMFSRIVPRNECDWEGEIVLLDMCEAMLYRIAFGSGDNLSEEDMDNGYDDYIMVDSYAITRDRPMHEVCTEIMSVGDVYDGQLGVEERDGGQMLIRRSEWKDGDIRRFIMDALEFVGMGEAGAEGLYRYVVYLTGRD